MDEEFWGAGARSLWSQAWQADEEGMNSEEEEEGQLALASFASFEAIDPELLIFIPQTTYQYHQIRQLRRSRRRSSFRGNPR